MSQSSASVSTLNSVKASKQVSPAHENGRVIEYQPAPAEISKPTLTTSGQPSRSLRMQYRYVRSLVWAFGLMLRLLFWHVLVDNVLGWHRLVERGKMHRWRYYARHFRTFAISMGGVMIKLGQFISTRVDMLPPEVTAELAGLQDEVPSVRFKNIRRVIEDDLGPIEQRFAWINKEPVAAASLGQVHRAQLLNGERVVVKVRRPGIERIVHTDLAALRIVARVANRLRYVNRRADANALIEEFGRVLLEELSYKNEAYNAVRFYEMFQENPGVYVPVVYHQHSSDRVLTMEDVTSIKINDHDAIKAAGVNLKAVANRLIDTYMTQVFDKRFFHADPHPGNLFVYPLPVEDEQTDFGDTGRPFYLIFVDFGMTGTLTERISAGLVNTMAAIITRDSRKLVRSYAELGFLLPDADLARIEEATEAAFDQVWGMNMTEIRDMDFAEVQALSGEFNDLLYDMPFYLPQDFIYLTRTVGILSGMSTSLDEDYNPWQELQRHWQGLIRNGIASATGDTMSLESLLTQQGTKTLMNLGQTLVQRAVNPTAELVNRIESGNVTFHVEQSNQMQRQMARIEAQSRRTTRAVLAGSALISATLLHVNGEPVLAAGAFAVAMVWFAGVLLGNDGR